MARGRVSTWILAIAALAAPASASASPKVTVTIAPATSPFGETINRAGTLRLDQLRNGEATITVESEIPRADMERAIARFLATLAPDIVKSQDIEAKLAAFRSFNNVAKAEYVVALSDGLLRSFKLSETVSVGESGKTMISRKTRSLTRIP